MGKKRAKNKAGSPKEDSSVDLIEVRCGHIRKGVEQSWLKKAGLEKNWTTCQGCEQERKQSEAQTEDEDQGEAQTIWTCLKCGHRGCGRFSDHKHAIKHYEKAHSDPHCLVLSLDNWSVWCYICDDEIQYSSTGRLAQLISNIKRQTLEGPGHRSSRKLKDEDNTAGDTAEEDAAPKEPEPKEEPKEVKKTGVAQNGPEPCSGAVPVRGLSNLGNTCFFNAVVQNLSQTRLLRQLLSGLWDEESSVVITPSPSTQLDPLQVRLSRPGPLTLAMCQLLNEIQETKRNVVTPRDLFTQVCKKAARFKGFQQQDSQELLRYLLDGMRNEENSRVTGGIGEALKGEGEGSEALQKKLLKDYGSAGTRTLVERVFGGETTSTVMCKECRTVSVVTESFLDLSLPVADEAYRKKKAAPQRSKERVDGGRGPEPPDATETEDVLTGTGSKYQQKKAKKQAKKQAKNQRRQQKLGTKLTLDSLTDDGPAGEEEQGDPESVGGADEATSQSEPAEINHHKPAEEEEEEKEEEGEERSPASNRFSSLSEERVDDERDESEEAELSRKVRGLSLTSEEKQNESVESGPRAESEVESGPRAESEVESGPRAESEVESGPRAESEVESGPRAESEVESGPRAESEAESRPRAESEAESRPRAKSEMESEAESRPQAESEAESEAATGPEFVIVNQDPDLAFSSLASRAALSSSQCSVESSLHQFTQVEELSDTNSLLCVTCSRRDGGKKKIYREALKQMLISSPPPVLTLHLKRFQQVAYSVCKVNRHVQFPQVLDLAPFCSVHCKVSFPPEGVQQEQTQVLYSLYGIVEHSGTMRSGHYTAFIKSRAHSGAADPREAGEAAPPKGSWFHVSDSSVTPVPESRVLNSQAYLLFYERIS